MHKVMHYCGTLRLYSENAGSFCMRDSKAVSGNANSSIATSLEKVYFLRRNQEKEGIRMHHEV
jgi:hypothetical protein